MEIYSGFTKTAPEYGGVESRARTYPEGQGADVAVPATGLVHAAVRKEVDVSDGSQESEAVRPDATAVRVDNLHVIRVGVVQTAIRG